jgi:hypothetical protein
MAHQLTHTHTEQKTGMAATIAIIAAIGSGLATFSGHPIWGLFIAIVAVLCGLIGFAMAASPRVRGGVLSLVSVGLGIIGVALAVIGIVGVIVF